MILVLIIGCGLGWVAHRARVQREAVAAIERAGGLVEYDWQWAGPNYTRIDIDRPTGPRWLRARVGPEFLDDVAYVALSGRTTTDMILPQVGRLPRLRYLSLSSDLVHNEALMHLEGLTRLEMLFIDCRSVDDDGMRHLEGLTRLEYLELGGDTQVTDAGIRRLRRALPGVEINGHNGRVYPRTSGRATGDQAK